MKTHALQKGVVWPFSLTAILVFSGLLCAGTGQASGVNQGITPKVNEYMDSLVKAGWFNGSILIARDGKVLISPGVRHGQLRTRRPEHAAESSASARSPSPSPLWR